ncbi:MAG: tRNA (adenosine(37)-N6)-threonylcarbamoyltransferase complex ATPase subunit type 1 TsaE [Bacteroidia bacterium]|nr:MAG: tRNA (adenosine(37)-N6)-threonylcarbamoyltransferase complex ATPase subunit type 1 TsaE [Bacteroidia bacterium]
MLYVVKNMEDWELLIHRILKDYAGKNIFLLKGTLGAGKTTFVQEFGKVLQVKEHITSPTFSIMHEYHFDGGTIYHFDLYRINNDRELKELGFEHFLEEGRYCLIEWPEMVEPVLKETEEWKNRCLVLEIFFNSEINCREVYVNEW